MNELKMVSVIMPNYNYARYIQQSIEAVLAQTYLNIELIIIDDASTDNSLEIIKNLSEKDHRIKVVVNDLNKGVVACRNLGIENARGMYLCFIDPDDIWEINKINLQLEALQKHNGNLCFTDIQIIDAEGVKGKIRKHYYHEYSYNSLLKRNFIPHSTLLVQKGLLENIRYEDIWVNNFQQWIMNKLAIKKIIHEDYVLLLKIFKTKNVQAVHLSQPLVLYRVHPNNYSGNYFKKFLSLYCIYRNTQGFNFIKSIFFTLRIAVLASIKNIS
jgi:glycosyltransferase involved in cell wall biosynthesis